MREIEVYPWSCFPLNEWSIVGMNHYFRAGQKHLFVAMCKNGKAIKAEGTNETGVFDSLKRQVMEIKP